MPGKDSGVIWQTHNLPEALLHMCGIAPREICAPHAAAEEQVAAYQKSVLLTVEADVPRRVSRRVDHHKLKLSYGNHLAIAQLHVNRWWLPNGPQHPVNFGLRAGCFVVRQVGRMQMYRGDVSMDFSQVSQRRDVFAVRVREQDVLYVEAKALCCPGSRLGVPRVDQNCLTGPCAADQVLVHHQRTDNVKHQHHLRPVEAAAEAEDSFSPPASRFLRRQARCAVG